MEKIILSFGKNNVDSDQSKAIETSVKNVEDFRKWPKLMLKYHQKNNNKEYLFYHELAGNLISCIVFDINKSTHKYGKMLSIGPSNLDNAQVEFEIHFEERLKTVLNSNPEELQADESKPKKRQKKNLSNEGNEEREKIPSRKKKKRDPGLVPFLTTYYKQDNVDNEVQLYICL